MADVYVSLEVSGDAICNDTKQGLLDQINILVEGWSAEHGISVYVDTKLEDSNQYGESEQLGYQTTQNLDFIKKKFRRALLNGPPNSGKTTSLRTWPGPIHCLIAPNEKGNTSLSFQTTDGQPIIGYWPDDVDLSKSHDWRKELKDWELLTTDVISGKKGPIKTLAIDGLHKLYELFLAEVTSGANYTGVKFDAVVYVQSHAKFKKYINEVLNSSIDNIVMTCWDNPEIDNALDTSKEGQQKKHNLPDLPGKMAKAILGEFSIALSSGIEGVGKSARYYWQTTPGGYNWGAVTKLPFEVMERLNLNREVDQNWTKLDSQIMTVIDSVIPKHKEAV